MLTTGLIMRLSDTFSTTKRKGGRRHHNRSYAHWTNQAGVRGCCRVLSYLFDGDASNRQRHQAGPDRRNQGEHYQGSALLSSEALDRVERVQAFPEGKSLSLTANRDNREATCRCVAGVLHSRFRSLTGRTGLSKRPRCGFKAHRKHQTFVGVRREEYTYPREN